jgi:protein phosphatase
MSAAVGPPTLRVAGDSNVGSVRTNNEDALIVDPARGLYVVLDGMGGANAGDIASQTARDTIHQRIAQAPAGISPRELIEAAIQAASAAVHGSAQLVRERHGMGTTVVACLIVDAATALIAHVGDSRAYLLRNGRLAQLTKDHTIVEELLERGAITAEEAERHAYKNVLSRNLGSRPETRVDVLELKLHPGDRVMLCSDGLYGYASTEAIQYLLGSGDAPEHVVRDLIDLALRGGGGDNVSAIVVEVAGALATSTQLVRGSGAIAWWQHRARFLALAEERGLTRSPLCRGLAPAEALELVAGSLCEAIFHDLEKSTGVNVWTFAQNLASGWFERTGEWGPLRALLDLLGNAARAVVDEVRGRDAQLGFLLEVAIGRALVVAELAIGGLLGERLRLVDAELIQLRARQQAAQAAEVERERQSQQVIAVRARREDPAASGPPSAGGFVEQETIPFLRPDRPVTTSEISPELAAAIRAVLTIARARVSPRAEAVKQVLTALDELATEGGKNEVAVLAARELFGVRSVDDAGITPLFDALDQGRILVAASVHQIKTSDPLRARAMRALSSAHQRLVGAVAGLVIEAVVPVSDRLREAVAATAVLRTQIERAERRRADLEKRFATVVDPGEPWGARARGSTEW